MEAEHPASMTARAVKQALPDRAIVTKDARVMINTATSMFTLYLSSIAHDISTKNKRITITLKDVLAALKETEFDQFLEPVEQCLQDTKAADARKRARKEAEKNTAAEGVEGGDVLDIETPAAVEAAVEQEEVPMETDADLDGEQTIDEAESVDEGEDEDDGEASAGDATEEASVASVTSGDVAPSAPEMAVNDAMEETKSSEE